MPLELSGASFLHSQLQLCTETSSVDNTYRHWQNNCSPRRLFQEEPWNSASLKIVSDTCTTESITGFFDGSHSGIYLYIRPSILLTLQQLACAYPIMIVISLELLHVHTQPRTQAHSTYYPPLCKVHVDYRNKSYSMRSKNFQINVIKAKKKKKKKKHLQVSDN